MTRETKQILSGDEDPLVSIVIPVWNDAANLRRCLAALRAQSYPASRLQVIVVDNGSIDDSYAVARSFPGIEVLQELAPGSYAARNAGLARVEGDYIAFLDADCEPDPLWIERGVAAARREPDLGVLAGRVDISDDGSSAPSGAALFERLFAFNQRENARYGTSVTANWLSPKAVLDRFGPFDASLKSGGDFKLSRQISQAGYRVVYCDEMIVRHPPRSTLRALLGKRRRIIGGNWMKTLPSASKPVRLAAAINRGAVGRTIETLKTRDLSLLQRLRVVGAIAAVWAVGILELARLTLGAEPRR